MFNINYSVMELTAGNWIAIISTLLGYFIAIVAIYIDARLRIGRLEAMMKAMVNSHDEYKGENKMDINKIHDIIRKNQADISNKIDNIHRILLEQKQ